MPPGTSDTPPPPPDRRPASAAGSPTLEEREVKIRITDPEAAEAALRQRGAVQLGREVLEDDVLFDDGDGTLRARQRVLRLRVQTDAGGSGEVVRSAITWKGPPRVDAGMRVREEIETTLGDASLLRLVLERLGFHATFRYQKRRLAFRLNGAIVAVDRTPLGTFLEIEGDTVAVDATATALGYGPQDYLTASYAALWRERRPAGGDMLLESGPGSPAPPA